MQLFGDNFWQLLVTAWQTFLGLPWPLLAGGAVLCCFEIVSQQQQHWKGCIGTLTSDAVDERLRPAGPRKLATAPPQQLSNLHPPTCSPDFAIKAKNWPPDLRTTLPADWLLNCLSGHWLHSMHQICNRSICGPARQPMQFQTKYGQKPQFCIQMGEK